MLVPAQLDYLDGVPYSRAFGDVYHSAAGGVAQARHVFLNGNRVLERWRACERFVIVETGFGAGVNFLATWQAWRNASERCRRLHFVSIEKHPFARADLERFLASSPEVRREARELEARWPMLVPGAHRIEFDGGDVVLTLFFADVKIARELRLAADAFYLDGFAPAKNPEMWSPQIMRSLARLAAPGATAATWSVAATVRHALEETGFAVEKRPGFGDKREMLVAEYRKTGAPRSFPKDRSAVVVGAGVAGGAVCERLCARGWSVTLIERHAEPAAEASGNHAGTFHPIVAADDSVFARITRAGYLYALNRWPFLDELKWDRCGVLQLARDEREDESQRRSFAALGLPSEYAQYVTRDEASRHAGVPLAAGGLWFAQAGWVQPKSLVEAQLEACGPRLERRFGHELKTLPGDTVVVLAASAESPKLHPVPSLRLRRVRGQLTYVDGDAIEAPHVVVLRGGMVLPPVEGLCVLGASYDIDDEDPAPRSESDEGNLRRAAQIIALPAHVEPVGGRVGFRAVTPDRLPVLGRLGENRYAAFAYGSRGLIWGALAAELIASQLEGDPLPLEGRLVDALSPARFALRAARRRNSVPDTELGSAHPQD